VNLVDLGLSSWPFEIVPPTRPTQKWYGRSQFRSDLERIVQSWTFKPTSSIYLMWADFGAGKTHALRFLEAASGNTSAPALAVYAELPAETSDFHGVYQQIVRRIPESALRSAIYGLRDTEGDSWLDADGLMGDRDTPRVLWQLAELPNDEVGESARKWLFGERVTSKELKALGGVAAVKSSTDALRTLVTIQHLLVTYGGYSRFVLLLDEFQRVGQSNARKLRDVNAGLHRFYNSCPQGLSMFLSYSIGVASAIKHLVTDELLSRVEERLSLETMEPKAGVAFVADTLAGSSIEGSLVPTFEETAIDAIVRRLDVDSDNRVTPRRLMQVFGHILEGVLTTPGQAAPPIDSELALSLYRPPPADFGG
jgi:hypothetical protein